MTFHRPGDVSCRHTPDLACSSGTGHAEAGLGCPWLRGSTTGKRPGRRETSPCSGGSHTCMCMCLSVCLCAWVHACVHMCVHNCVRVRGCLALSLQTLGSAGSCCEAGKQRAGKRPRTPLSAPATPGLSRLSRSLRPQWGRSPFGGRSGMCIGQGPRVPHFSAHPKPGVWV